MNLNNEYNIMSVDDKVRLSKSIAYISKTIEYLNKSTPLILNLSYISIYRLFLTQTMLSQIKNYFIEVLNDPEWIKYGENNII